MLSLRKRILVAMAGIGVLAACGARTGTASGRPVDASVATDASVEDANADVGPSTCAKAREQCFTKAELEALWNNPPLGGDGVDAGPPPFDPNGCLPPAVVRDTCCNVAASGPRFQAGVCCYTFCTGSCC